MIRMKDLLRDTLVIEDISASDRNGVISEFAELLRSAGLVGDKDEIIRLLVDRETLGSTGVGDGVAIPHGKVPGLQEMIVSFGRSRKGVDFESMDGKPAYLFFLLLVPPNNPGEHLKMLARISRILKNPALREQLRSAHDGREIRQMIIEEDSKYPQP